MATGAQIQARIKALLAKLQATPRVVQFREVTQTGGNSRLGIGGTSTVTLTEIEAQPAAEMVSAEELAGAAGSLQPGDWRFIFDGTVSEDVLRTQQILFGTEVLHIVRYEPYALNKVVVGWSVIGRTVTTR